MGRKRRGEYTQQQYSAKSSATACREAGALAWTKFGLSGVSATFALRMGALYSIDSFARCLEPTRRDRKGTVLQHLHGDGPSRAPTSNKVIDMKWNLKVLPLIALAAALGTTGVFAQSSQQAQTAVPSSGMDMQSMKAQMEQMRAQMEQMQTLMKDNMAKMAAADAAQEPYGNGTSQHEEPDGTGACDH